MRTVRKRAKRLQTGKGDEAQLSQLSTGVSRINYPVTSQNWDRVRAGTAPKVAITPTTADLVALHGGRARLLRVAEVAERLGSARRPSIACARAGELPHIRIVKLDPSPSRGCKCLRRDQGIGRSSGLCPIVALHVNPPTSRFPRPCGPAGTYSVKSASHDGDVSTELRKEHPAWGTLESISQGARYLPIRTHARRAGRS